MNARELTLNIAVNMGRLCRFAADKRTTRVNQFLNETQIYIDQLEQTPKNEKFIPTYLQFKTKFSELKNNVVLDDKWAESALTWANILTHRAKLLE